LEIFVVEFLPTPELELFGVEIIQDRIFTGARVRNIASKPSEHKPINV
jgi:hypothetical protein